MKALYEYQEHSVKKMLSLGGRGLIANDVGTGKTLVALETARRLGVRHVLVVCPIAVAPIWERELADALPDFLFVDATLGSIKQRAQRIHEHRDRRDQLIAVGYESYWREPLRSVIAKLSPELVIYDEGHRLKGRGTRQARFAHGMRDTATHVLPLSATPMPKGPEDMFSIYKAIRTDVFGLRWQDFEDEFLKVTRRPGFPMITGYKNQAEFERRVHATAVRITKEDALDLPEEVDVTVPIALSRRTRGYYDELRKQAIVEVESTSGETGVALSQVVLTNLQRLQQITSGFVKVTDGRELELSSEKLDTLEDLLGDLMPRRVVVFCRFTHDVHRVHEMVAKFGRAFELSGRIPEKQRRASIAQFGKEDTAILVCQIQVASLGIDLTAANIAVFFSVDYDLMTYIQSRGRLHRHGQTNKVTHYLFAARNTVDEKIYKALARKENLAASVLDRSSARDIFEIDEERIT